MSKYGRHYPKKEKKPEDDPFVPTKVYIPKSLHHMLKTLSDKIKMPVSKLIVMAIDNEFDTSSPFFYPTELPTSPFVADAYTDEAGKIYQFLEKIDYGIGLDHLLLARRDIGIFSKDEFLLAYRELLEQKMIEEFYPSIIDT